MTNINQYSDNKYGVITMDNDLFAIRDIHTIEEMEEEEDDG
jgi:hypothetical protein